MFGNPFPLCFKRLQVYGPIKHPLCAYGLAQSEGLTWDIRYSSYFDSCPNPVAGSHCVEKVSEGTQGT